jgi:hypothetical protein
MARTSRKRLVRSRTRTNYHSARSASTSQAGLTLCGARCHGPPGGSIAAGGREVERRWPVNRVRLGASRAAMYWTEIYPSFPTLIT